MLIVPVRQSDHFVRRWPIVTALLILINVAVHVYVAWSAQDSDPNEYPARVAEALDYYAAHPYLQAPPELEKIARKTGAVRGSKPEARLFTDVYREQAKLDSMWQAAKDVQDTLIWVRYGDRPSHGGLTTLVTSQFLHAGWLHLFFNMWFLWLVGCNIEDRWGRILYPLFYLTAGAVAAMAHRLAVPDSDVPTIGASGAVAGAMGAFLMRHATARIEFWAWIILPFRFRAPAFLMLPLWLAVEVGEGVMTGSVSSVAHWAHVGGFVFGAVVALGVWKSGLEKSIDSAIESEHAPGLDEAAAFESEGRLHDAVAVLQRVAADDPSSIDAQRALVRLARRTSDATLEAQATLRALSLLTQHSMDAPAADLFAEARARGMDRALPAALRMRVIRSLERAGRVAEAEAAYRAVHGDDPRDEPALMALLGHAQLLLQRGRAAEAKALFERARDAPFPHAHLDGAIEQGLRAASR